MNRNELSTKLTLSEVYPRTSQSVLERNPYNLTFFTLIAFYFYLRFLFGGVGPLVKVS